MPALVLYGEKEPAYFHAHAKRLQQQLPDVAVTVVPGAGHASNLDAPEFFTEALRSFVARVQAHAGPAAAEVAPTPTVARPDATA